MAKSYLGEDDGGKVCLAYTSRSWSNIEDNQGRNLEVGTETDEMEESCILT